MAKNHLGNGFCHDRRDQIFGILSSPCLNCYSRIEHQELKLKEKLALTSCV